MYRIAQHVADGSPFGTFTVWGGRMREGIVSMMALEAAGELDPETRRPGDRASSPPPR